MENANWFFKIGDEVQGPLSPRELQHEVAAGHVGPDTLVRNGEREWARADTCYFLVETFNKRKSEAAILGALVEGAGACLILLVLCIVGTVADFVQVRSTLLDRGAAVALLLAGFGIIKAVYTVFSTPWSLTRRVLIDLWRNRGSSSPPGLSPLPESVAPSRGARGERSIRHGVPMVARGESSQKPDRVWPVTRIMGIACFSALLFLLWSLAGCRGGSARQAGSKSDESVVVDEDQPPMSPEERAMIDKLKSVRDRIPLGDEELKKRASALAAKTQLAAFKTPLNVYRLDTGDYPSTAQGLEALTRCPSDLANPDVWHGPYLDTGIPLDPWGNPYQYAWAGDRNKRKNNINRPDIWSWGPDGTANTSDDIAIWNELSH